MIRISTPFLLASLIGLSFMAQAEDDVLSILGEGGNPEVAQGSKNVDVSPFRKIFSQASGDQNLFFATLEKGEYEKALVEYFSVFGKTDHHRSANGQGLLAYLLLKNGLTVYAVEGLFANANPAQMAPAMGELLYEQLPDTHAVWKQARLQWRPEWTKIFSPSIEVQVKSKKIFTGKDVNELKEIIKVAAPNTVDRAAIQWQLVLALAMNGDNMTAAKLLHNLINTKENPVQPDLTNITAARMLFENGFMDAAIKYYQKVPTKSEFWLEAQEEMGWSYLRKGEPQNTIAVTGSLVIPEFQNIVGPETVFLRSLGQLKVCDYPGVIKTLSIFKDRFRPKTVEMMKIVENADQPATRELISKMKTKRLTQKELGKLASKLPRLVSRDESFYRNVLLERELGKEAEIATAIYGRSLANGASKIGLQADLEAFKKSIDGRVNDVHNAALERLKVLAQEEITDTHRLLQKLHIVEAEVLQQAMAIQKVTAATQNQKAIEKKGTTGSTGRDRISFPVTDNQLWFDEISHYKVDVVKGCQAIKR